MNIRVESYSGYKADERPLRFYLGERWLEVEEVLDRWYDPEATYFRVRTAGDELWVLRRSEPEGAWTLAAYRRPPEPPGAL